MHWLPVIWKKLKSCSMRQDSWNTPARGSETAVDGCTCYVETGKKQIYSSRTSSKKGPRFPEPYVHHAQVKIHFGQVGDAIELLKKALDARYANTSGFSKEIIQGMIDGLENPETRRKSAMEIDRDTISVAVGKKTCINRPSIPPPEDEYILDGFAKPKKQKKAAAKQQKKMLDETDERTPNTDLTEEDLEYIRKHNLE